MIIYKLTRDCYSPSGRTQENYFFGTEGEMLAKEKALKDGASPSRKTVIFRCQAYFLKPLKAGIVELLNAHASWS